MYEPDEVVRRKYVRRVIPVEIEEVRKLIQCRYE